MRDRLFAWLAAAIGAHPVRVLVGGFAAAVLAVVLVMWLGVDTRTRVMDLLPANDPAATAYARIVDEFQSASQIIVVAQGPDRRALERFADALDARIHTVRYRDPEDGRDKPFVRHAFVKMDREFLQRHGLMLAKRSDLEKLETLYADLRPEALLAAYNDFLEMEYIEDDAAVTEREKEDAAINNLRAVTAWIAAFAQDPSDARGLSETARTVAEKLVLGDMYMVSDDGTMLLAQVVPTVSLDQTDAVLDGTRNLRALVEQVASQFSGVRVGLTGMAAMSLEEMEVTMQDMGVSTLVALLLVFLLFVWSFRMWTAPLLAVVNLVIAIVLTAGFVAVAVGRFNMLTLSFALILVGLGIDFAIHLNAAFCGAASQGGSLSQVLGRMYATCGKGVITGGLTTATAFFALVLTDLDALQEMGVVLGAGITIAMVSSLILLPAMFGVHYLVRAKKGRSAWKQGVTLSALGTVGDAMQKRRWAATAVAVCVALTAAAVWKSRDARFVGDLLEMEPEDMPSVVLHRRILDTFEINPDFAMIPVADVAEARRIEKRLKKNRLVGRVDSLAAFVPSPRDQRRRRAVVERIARTAREHLAADAPWRKVRADADTAAAFLEEVHRFRDNVAEIGQLAVLSVRNRLQRACAALTGDGPDGLPALEKTLRGLGDLPKRLDAFAQAYVPHLAATLVRAADTSEISLASLPRSIVDRYVGKNGTQLVTVYASVNLWKGDAAELFRKAVSRVSDKVTGTVVLMDRLMDLVAAEGARAVWYTLAAVFLLLLLDFHSLSAAVLAMIPLVVGFVWMLGAFVAAGYKFDPTNVMAVPLILGIGIDDGVHILHALRREGTGGIGAVLRTIGRAVFLTSLTTAIAFGSMAFASHRGLAGMGVLLTMGVVAALITSVFLLPAVVALGPKRSGKERSDA